MKPGDLVYVDPGWGITADDCEIGLIIGYDEEPNLANPIQVLVNGKITGYNYYELKQMSDQNEAR